MSVLAHHCDSGADRTTRPGFVDRSHTVVVLFVRGDSSVLVVFMLVVSVIVVFLLLGFCSVPSVGDTGFVPRFGVCFVTLRISARRCVL